MREKAVEIFEVLESLEGVGRDLPDDWPEGLGVDLDFGPGEHRNHLKQIRKLFFKWLLVESTKRGRLSETAAEVRAFALSVRSFAAMAREVLDRGDSNSPEELEALKDADQRLIDHENALALTILTPAEHTAISGEPLWLLDLLTYAETEDGEVKFSDAACRVEGLTEGAIQRTLEVVGHRALKLVYPKSWRGQPGERVYSDAEIRVGLSLPLVLRDHFNQ